ncbi:MAG: biotin/lipoyl-containing protein, partial [Alphaproteobacteria bacterium]
QEFFVDLEKGQRLYIRYLAISDPDRKGKRTAFFELNGQPRNATVVDRSAAPAEAARAQADGSPGQVGAPMPGTVTGLSVKLGQHVEKGDALLGIEAMKMETTIFAEVSGTVTEISVAAGDAVETKELLVIIEDD